MVWAGFYERVQRGPWLASPLYYQVFLIMVKSLTPFTC